MYGADHAIYRGALHSVHRVVHKCYLQWMTCEAPKAYIVKGDLLHIFCSMKKNKSLENIHYMHHLHQIL